MSYPHAWVPRTGNASAVLVSSSQQLRDEVARAAAAAGMDLLQAASCIEAEHLDPAVLLVDAAHAGARPPGSTRFVLVGLPGEEELLWREAARLRAARVAVLPHAAAWLVEYLNRLGVRASGGQVVGIAASAGGVGATTLSCWLAAHAGWAGHAALLVDGSFAGGSLELAAAAEEIPGARWADLADVSGNLNPEQLAASLPDIGPFALLSSASARIQEPVLSPESLQSVMEAARSAFTLTVIDLPRSAPEAQQLLPFCDVVLLVIPGRLRAIAGARRDRARLAGYSVGAVVRGPLPSELDPVRVADAAGCSLAGYLPELRGVAGSERDGRLLAAGKTRAVRRLAIDILRGLPAHQKRPADHGRPVNREGQVNQGRLHRSRRLAAGERLAG